MFGQMNEIVGESGTPGKPGCAMTVAMVSLALILTVPAVWLVLA